MFQNQRGQEPYTINLELQTSPKHSLASSPGPQSSSESTYSNLFDPTSTANRPAEMRDADVEKAAPDVAAKPSGVSDEDLYQPKSLKFWMTLVCNFLALFLVALDRTIIATAIPQITDDFHSLGDIGWYGSAYMLTTSCAQLVYGRIYKFYDTKW